MKGNSVLYIHHNKLIASANISFMPETGPKSLFAKYIANRPDIDPDGMFDIIAHGNSDQIEIVNNYKNIRINAREASKLIKRLPGYKKAKSIRLFSCNTGSTVNGFGQNLANALEKPVYAPNMTIYSNYRGAYWISDKGKRGEFVKFIPGGYRNGK